MKEATTFQETRTFTKIWAYKVYLYSYLSKRSIVPSSKKKWTIMRKNQAYQTMWSKWGCSF